MKKLGSLLLAFFACWQMIHAQAAHLNITPAHPKPGDLVRFEYDIAKSPLSKATDPIEVITHTFTDKAPDARDAMVQYADGKISGQFVVPADALVALLGFKAGERLDNNNGEGYFIQLSDPNGKTLPQSLAAQAVLYRDWGSVFELNRKATVALDLLNQAFAAKSTLRQQYFSAYITSLMAVKRGDAGKGEALAILDEIEKTPNLEEKDRIVLAGLYERIGSTDKAKAIRDDIRKNFPKGSFVRRERRQSMRNEADLAKMEGLVEAYVKEFPAANETERSEAGELYSSLGNKAAEKKDWALVKRIVSKMQPAQKASLYNNIAWDLAENDKDLEMAREMAAEATQWTKMEIYTPTQTKDAYLTQHEWEVERKDNFAQYADTYAYVLDKLGDPNSAALYQAQVVEITKGENSDMNERYTAYLERTAAPDLRYRLEGFIIHGQATGKMKEQFKRLYAAEDKSTAGADAYMAGLEKLAKINKKKELSAKMLDQPASGFSLKNLKGEDVSLESLKGKVVILDFWATWCGPCKASFPGMQQALTNYKDDANVAFLFIDTWERADDKVKNAGDFIASKGYPFNVLMDNEDKVVSAYGVTGIPTKFIVDKSGKVRFKSVGYPGSSEALVDELSIMIDLAKEQP